MPSESPVDTIKLPAGFDYDDILISHDSEMSDSDGEDSSNLTNMLKDVIDGIMEKERKNNIDDDI